MLDILATAEKRNRQVQKIVRAMTKTPLVETVAILTAHMSYEDLRDYAGWLETQPK